MVMIDEKNKNFCTSSRAFSGAELSDAPGAGRRGKRCGGYGRRFGGPAAAEEAAQDPAEDTATQRPSSPPTPISRSRPKAALLIDLNTGRTVYEQDADERVYPASLTKIMTCLLALENGNLSDVITIDEAALAGLDQDSSVVGLQVGEQITLENLLYCMMVHSGNDAANAVAEYIAGRRRTLSA